MKIALVFAFCIIGCSAVFGQKIIDIPTASRVLTETPPPPSLTMEMAIEIATKYIAKNKININGRHLTYASLMKFGSPGDLRPAWQLFWTSGKPFDCFNIEIIVSDDTHLAMRKVAP